MEEILPKILEVFLLIVAFVAATKMFKKVTGKSMFRALTPIGEVLKESEKAADRIAKDITKKRNERKESKKKQPVQIKFGGDKMTSKAPLKQIHNWDIPNVNDIGKNEGISIEDTKKKNKRARAERDFIRSSGNAIKSFEEFIRPDRLQVDLGDQGIMLHDLNTGKFVVNSIEYGAQIDRVTGLQFIGKSRIDGNPVVRIKVGSENPLIVKVNLHENRFELIKSMDDHVAQTFPSPSNIDDYWGSAIAKQTINAKPFK